MCIHIIMAYPPEGGEDSNAGRCRKSNLVSGKLPALTTHHSPLTPHHSPLTPHHSPALPPPLQVVDHLDHVIPPFFEQREQRQDRYPQHDAADPPHPRLGLVHRGVPDTRKDHQE